MNSLIAYIEHGYPPPESFIYLDSNNFIQNQNGVPVIYHIFRRTNVKCFNVHHFNDINWLRFNTNLSNKDQIEYEKARLKYWWLVA